MIGTEGILLFAGLIAASSVFFALRAVRAQGHARQALDEAERRERSTQLMMERIGSRLDEALEHCGAAVIGLDENLVVTFANRLAHRIAGLDVVGLPLIQAILSVELQSLARRVFEDRTPKELEIRDIGPDKRVLVAKVVPSTDRAMILIFMQDVSEVRLLETVRRDFVANVSHELRTPLASIRAMAETLASGAVEQKSMSKRFLTMIVAESDRLTRIADDLLVLSRAEMVAATRERFDVCQLAKDVVARFKQRASKEEIILKLEAPGGIELFASRDQVEESLVNLLDNAVKYSSHGGTVTVSIARRAGHVAIGVSDTGIGILQEDIPRVFERFYRVDKARSRRTGGTGLGLSIVKHVAESHGGSVHVESEFNRGSTFTMLLPDGESAETQDEPVPIQNPV